MKLEAAREAAEALVETLWPACERIEIAGSIRRRKAEVKDIEIVTAPKISRVAARASLFSTEYVTQNQLDRMLECWIKEGIIEYRLDKNRRPCWGQAYKRLALPDGIALDLFSVVNKAQWGLILMIRTGSGVGLDGRSATGFGPAMLARWKQVSGGGKSVGGCLYQPDGTPVPTPEEESVFEVCRVKWVPPEQRIDARVVRRYAIDCC